MDILILTSAEGVSDAAASAFFDHLSGKKNRRLGDCGVELEVTSKMDVTGLAQEYDLDANFVSGSERRKRLLIADMDSTMIPVECIDELADFAGVRDEVEAITERAMRGEMDFEEAIDARVALLKGLSISVIEECYEARISLNPGARTLVRTMSENGAFTALVSGGFTAFTSRVAEAAGFAVHHANRLLHEDGHLSGTVQRPILGKDAKRDFLTRFCREQGIEPKQSLAVGDGANDLEMIKAAGLGVAYKAKPILKEHADIRLDFSDLSALLFIQGYSEGQFVTD